MVEDTGSRRARRAERQTGLAQVHNGHVVRRFTRPVRYVRPHESTPVGIIVPFDFELDWEYWRYLPLDVSLYFTRTPLVRKPVGVAMAKDLSRPSTIWRATQALNAVDPEVVLYACSSGSFIRGPAGEEAIRRTMIEAGAKRAVTTSGAMLDAFRVAGARRVAIAGPYTERLTQALVDFIEEAGFQVVSASYLGLPRRIAEVSHETIADLVHEASHPDADLLFVSCTALRTYGIVATLEESIGVPVFTSNQVSLWGALCATGSLYRDSDELAPEEIPGGANPLARSTDLLLTHAREEHAHLAEQTDATMATTTTEPEQVIVS